METLIDKFERSEAVESGVIELYALRDNENPCGVKLGMLMLLRPLRGRWNRGNPSVHLQDELDSTAN